MRPCPFLSLVFAVSMLRVSAADTATVDAHTVYQRIDGFGASCAFSGRSWTDATADLFFSTTNGIGLSLLRNRIQPDGTASASEIGLMQKAQARGARIWSAPWSPPAAYKDNNAVIGGNFVSANNQAYADVLAAYVAQMKTRYGIAVYAVSVQNEPDWSPTTYEGCTWTGQQIHDFVPYLRSALDGKGGADTRIMLPESLHWQSNPGLYTPSVNDPAVASLVGIIGNHNYDGPNATTGSTATPAALPHPGKALWETEVMTSGDTFDSGIANALYWAQRIHLFLTAAQVNAWHYWWLIPYSNDNQALEGIGDVPTKRMYAVGQFSRFVRPGFYRIGVTNSGNALISAVKDPATGNFAIVAVNRTAAAITQGFTLSGFTADSVAPWVTSDAESLQPHAPLPVSNASFTATLEANSITTYVGHDSTPPLPPSASRITNLSIRSRTSVGSETLMAGFVIAGGTKSLLVRAAGPVLTTFNVPGALAAPQLALRATTTGTLLASNSGWDTAANAASIASAAQALGAFPFPTQSPDAALLTTLPDGLYSASVNGANGTAGVALVEIYDAATSTGGRLVNVSARTQVGTGADILIAGFTIEGSEPKTLLIRGVGQTLSQYGIGGTVPDPQLTIVNNQTGAQVAQSTAWGSSNPAALVAAAGAVNAFPLVNDGTDAALLLTLPPGLYSAKLGSVSGSTGVALVEIYEVR